jgi:hypothetical protein
MDPASVRRHPHLWTGAPPVHHAGWELIIVPVPGPTAASHRVSDLPPMINC